MSDAPAAISPVMMPVSTSPVPAAASALLSVRLITAYPSGAQTTVPGPFNTTIESSAAARSRAASTRSAAGR